MRTYASAEERAAKNQKTTVRHFGFTEKVYGLPYTVRTMLLWKRHHRNAIVRILFFLRGAIAVEARRRRAASARYIYIQGSKNVFHQNQYRCRDGAPDQVAAWKNQLAEKV